MFAPFRLRSMELVNRVVVSPMAQYRAVDGCPTDWHFVHYAERAKGGAGLVTIEMTCVSPEGRITPGCTGLYAPEHEAAWRRLTTFVHAETDAKICAQIGHSGRKGRRNSAGRRATRRSPRATGRCCRPRRSRGRPPTRCRREMDRADMDRVTAQFVAVDPDGRAGGVRHGRAARRARLPAVVVHLAGVEPPHRRVRRIARAAHALPARGVRGDAGRLAGPTSRCRCASAPTTGSATTA